MQFIRRHYEKLILGLFLVALLLTSAHLLRGIRQARLGTVEPGSIRASELPMLSTDQFAAARLLREPDVEWAAGDRAGKGNLMAPGDYVWCVDPKCHYWIPLEADKCPVCGADQGIGRPKPKENDSDRDGISDEDEEKYAFLDPSDPYDSQRDQDLDWFTNLEEFEAGTAMDKAEEHPRLATKLYLLEVSRERFPILFDSLMVSQADDPVEKWDIGLRTFTKGIWRSRFARLGEVVDGYRIVMVDRKRNKVFNPQVNDYISSDASTVTLQKGGEEPIVLVRGEQTYSGNAVKFILVIDPTDRRKIKTYSVKAGEPLVLIDSTGNEERYTVNIKNSGEISVKPENHPEAAEIPIGKFRRELGVEQAPGAGLFEPGAMMPGSYSPDGVMPPIQRAAPR